MGMLVVDHASSAGHADSQPASGFLKVNGLPISLDRAPGRPLSAASCRFPTSLRTFLLG